MAHSSMSSPDADELEAELCDEVGPMCFELSVVDVSCLLPMVLIPRIWMHEPSLKKHVRQKESMSSVIH